MPRLLLGVGVAAVLVAGAFAQGTQPTPCRALRSGALQIDGRATSGGVPLPGVSIAVHVGDAVKAATSTDIDGRFTILFAPGASYRVSADLTGFATVERNLTLGAPPCDQALDVQLALRPRTDSPAPQANAPSASAAPPASAPAVGRVPPVAPTGRGAAGAGRGGRGFQALNVQTDANGAATLDAAPAQETADEVTRLLPAGFSLQSAQADAVAINGSADATTLNRGQLNGRLQAIDAGRLNPATGQLGAGLAAQLGGPGLGGGGRGGPGGFAGRGGGPGRGGFVLGGRGARGQSPYRDRRRIRSAAPC